MRGRLSANVHKLFGRTEAVSAWADMLTRLARGDGRGALEEGDGGVYVEEGGTFRLVEDDEELETMLQ